MDYEIALEEAKQKILIAKIIKWIPTIFALLPWATIPIEIILIIIGAVMGAKDTPLLDLCFSVVGFTANHFGMYLLMVVVSLCLRNLPNIVYEYEEQKLQDIKDPLGAQMRKEKEAREIRRQYLEKEIQQTRPDLVDLSGTLTQEAYNIIKSKLKEEFPNVDKTRFERMADSLPTNEIAEYQNLINKAREEGKEVLNPMGEIRRPILEEFDKQLGHDEGTAIYLCNTGKLSR